MKKDKSAINKGGREIKRHWIMKHMHKSISGDVKNAILKKDATAQNSQQKATSIVTK